MATDRLVGRGRVCFVSPETASREHGAVGACNLAAARGMSGDWRRDRLAGRIAAQAAYLGPAPPDAVDVERRPSGAPVYRIRGQRDDRYYLSIAHSRGWGVAACADVPVGVDLECCRPISHDVATRAATPRELAVAEAHRPGIGADAFLMTWTLKEAAVKLLEGGVAVPAVRVMDGDEEGVTLHLPDGRLAKGCCYFLLGDAVIIGLAWLHLRDTIACVSWEWFEVCEHVGLGAPLTPLADTPFCVLHQRHPAKSAKTGPLVCPPGEVLRAGVVDAG